MTPGQQMFVTVFGAIIGSGLINILIQHHWEKTSELSKLTSTVLSMNEKIDKNAAIAARCSVLKFDDELLNGISHSKEYFRQILEDIDTYERFCSEHHDFKNSYTVEATKHIREVYEKLISSGEFASGT